MQDREVPREQLKKLSQAENEFVELVLHHSADKLKLFLSCSLKPNTPAHTFTNNELEKLMDDILPPAAREQVNQNAFSPIASILTGGDSVSPRRIFKGIAPEHGEDGRLVLSVKKYDPRGKEIDEHRKNLRNLHLYDNIRPEGEIGRIFHPTSGKDGRDVFGNTIPAKPGTEAKANFDSTITRKPTKAGEPYDSLTANIAGCLVEEGGRLTIKDELRIAGDVDYKTGSIDFVGKVFVSENVQPDFEVLAQGAVNVLRHVQGGYVESTDSVTVGGTIVGGSSNGSSDAGRRHVLCEGQLKALRIQGASVEAGGRIEVDREIMNSTIRTRDALSIPLGRLFGGIIYATNGIEAGYIGTSAGSRTHIHLSSEVESTQKYSELSRSIEVNNEALKLLSLRLGPHIDATPEAIVALREPTRSKMLKLRKKLVEIQRSLERLTAEREQLLEGVKQQKTVRVSFHKMLHRGVRIHAQEKIFEVNEDIPGPKSIEFSTESGEFAVVELCAEQNSNKEPKKS